MLIHYYSYFNIFYYNRLCFFVFCDTIFLVIIMGREITLDERDILEKLGTELRKVRKSKKLTLDDVSKETHIKVDYISKYENGKKEIGYLTLKKLCTFYRINIATLLYKIEPIANNDFSKSLEELKASAKSILSKAEVLNREYIKK